MKDVKQRIKDLMAQVKGKPAGAVEREISKMGIFLREMIDSVSAPVSGAPADDPFLVAEDRFEDLHKKAKMKLGTKL